MVLFFYSVGGKNTTFHVDQSSKSIRSKLSKWPKGEDRAPDETKILYKPEK